MNLELPELRIGEAMQRDGVTVYPLYMEPAHRIEYVLGPDAMKEGYARVTEIDEQGRVGKLCIVNDGDVRLLFLEGMVLSGAKQNRVLNSSLIVPANCKIDVPVSCVEQGRWTRGGGEFQAEPYFAPADVREAVKTSVTESLKRTQSHVADQARVWQCVEREQAELGVCSSTKNVSDTFQNRKTAVDALLDDLAYVPGACGMVVALPGGKVAMELYDRPETCSSLWRQVLAGLAIDAFKSPERHETTTPPAETLVTRLAELSWLQVAAAGEGEDYRATSDDDATASALCIDGNLVHVSALAR